MANYGGDAGFTPSVSAAVPITVTKAPTTVGLVASSNNVIQGDAVLFTANVSTNSAALPPAGTGDFFDGTPIATLR